MSKYIGRAQGVVANNAYSKTEVDTIVDNIDALPDQTGHAGQFLTTDGTSSDWAAVDLTTKVTKSGDTMTGDLAITSTGISPLVITGSDSDRARTQLINTTAGVSYVYHELEADGGRKGYLIQNGSGLGNGLAAEETYVWSGDGNVSLVPNAQIGNRLTVNTNGDVDINGQLRGAGMTLLGKASWTSNTASAVFDVFDSTRYTHYVVYWYVTHSPSWERTYLRLRNSSGNITSGDYWNNVRWRDSTSSADTINSSYAGNQSFVWLAGNGTAYNSHGQLLISIPRDGSSVSGIRGMSQLLRRNANNHYEEEFSSTLVYSSPHTSLTGFSIYGSSGSSSYGDITVFGIER